MTTVMPTSGTITPSSAGNTTAKSATTMSDYQMFLKLMTTQMQNQDPTEPMDNSEYATQLATFSQVEQQVKTNDLLGSLTNQIGGAGLGQYATWVGMEALSTAPAAFDGKTPVSVVTKPASGADEAILIVSDTAGKVVDKRAVPVRNTTFDWDGTTTNGQALPAGSYSLQLQSLSNGSVLSTTPVASYNRITEIRQDSTGSAVLVTAGGKEVSAKDVTALRETH